MGHKSKIIIVGYVISIIIGIIVINFTFSSHDFSQINIQEEIMTIKFTRIIDVDREHIFTVMTNIKNYPKILPNNIQEIRIINQTVGLNLMEKPAGGIIEFFEVDLYGKKVSKSMLLKHETWKGDLIFTHEIEIVNGDAKGSKIFQTFTKVKDGTEIQTEAAFRLKDDLTRFGLIPYSNFEHNIFSIFEKFVDHAKKIS